MTEPPVPTTEAALQAVWDIGDELDSNHARWAALKVAERFGVEIDAHNRFSDPPRNRNEEMIAELEANVAIEAEARAAAEQQNVALREALDHLSEGHDWGGGDDMGACICDAHNTASALLSAAAPAPARETDR